MTKTEEKKILFQRHEKDTGSPEAQIYFLSNEITELQKHLKSHAKDSHAKISLLKKVAKRRKLLKYLKEKNLESFLKVSKKYGLKA